MSPHESEFYLAQYKVNQTIVILKQADITEEDTDAIVNPANSHLAHGGGVAGAIVRKGGEVIQRESFKVAPVPVGGAAITGAGKLKASHVIHAVGPCMGEGDEDRKLHDATLSSLRLADENGIRSIAFPAISTGIFGYPIQRCSKIMLNSVREYCEGSTGIMEIRFCLFDQLALEEFRSVAEKVFPK